MASLSTILGWMSITCGVIVYTPQFLENYHLKSGEAISVMFVIIWLLGDVCNFIGACLAHLLPTVIILALYYTLSDALLLLQIYYYRWTDHRRQEARRMEPTEVSPLLEGEEEPKIHKRNSTGWLLAKYFAGFLFLISIIVVTWWISGRVMGEEGPLKWEVQTLGWSSAILYLGARLPQISKNSKTRCEGLSPALFVFSILGNTTYALSIFAASLDREYLITNASWLAGSVGAVLLDIIILAQVFYYHTVRVRQSVVSALHPAHSVWIKRASADCQESESHTLQ